VRLLLLLLLLLQKALVEVEVVIPQAALTNDVMFTNLADEVTVISEAASKWSR